METDDLDKILGKSYSELTASEKEVIQDLCATEEEFIHLQQVFASVENYARETIENSSPMPETKARLDDLFYDTYQSKGILWYNSLWASIYPAEKRFDQRPLVRIAAILILFICAVPFFNKSDMESKQLASTQKEAVQKDELEKAESAISPESSAVTVERDRYQPDATTQMEEQEVAPLLIASANKDAETADFSTALGSDLRKDQYEKASSAETFVWGETTNAAQHTDAGLDKYTDVDMAAKQRKLAMLDLLTPAF